MHHTFAAPAFTLIRPVALRARLCVSTALLAALTLVSVPALAQTWDGETSIDWTEGTNWNPDGAPVAADTATIAGNGANAPEILAGDSVQVTEVTVVDGTLTVSGSLTVTSITEINTTGAIVVNPGSTYSSVTTDIFDDGQFTIGAAITGNVRVNDNGLVRLNGGDISGALDISSGATVQAVANTTLTGGVIGVVSGQTGKITADDGVTLTLGTDIVSRGPNSTTTYGTAGVAGTVVVAPTFGIVIGGNSVINVAGGTLQVGTSFAGNNYFSVGTGISTSVDAGATIDMNGFNTTITRLSGAGTITNDGAAPATLTLSNPTGGATTFSGVIEDGTSPVALTKTGAATLTLSGDNTYTGTTRVNGGVLNVTGSIASSEIEVNAGGSLRVDGAAISDTATITLFGDGNLTLDGSETIGALSSTSVSSTVTLGANTLTLGGNNASTTFAGVMSGTGGLTKTGTGTLSLSGTNTYTGTTRISGGTILMQSSNVFASGSSLLVNGGSLDMNSHDNTFNNVTLSLGSITGTGEIFVNGTYSQSGGTLGADIVVESSNDKSLSGGTIAGKLGGTGRANVTGTVRLTGEIDSDATVTGKLEVDGGDVTGDLRLSGGTLAALSTSSISGVVDVWAGGGTITVATGSTLSLANLNPSSISHLTIGAAGQEGTVFVTGSSSQNAFATVSLEAGTLRIGGTTAANLLLGAIESTEIAAGAVLDINGYETYVKSLSGEGTVTNSGASAILVLVGEATFDGVIENGANTTSLRKQGTGTMTLAGENTYTGGTSVADGKLVISGSVASAVLGVTNNGILRVEGGAAISDTAFVNLLDNATLELGDDETIGRLAGESGATVKLEGNTLTTGGDNTSTTFAGVMTGTGGLTKTGLGTFALSGANSYSGSTTVNAGILDLTGSGTLDSTDIIIGSGGTLRTDGGALLTSTVIDNAGTLQVNGSESIASVSGEGSVAVSGVSTVLTLNSGESDISGSVTGSGRLQLDGGDATLSGAVNIAFINIRNGTLVLNGTEVNSVLGGILLEAGATLSLLTTNAAGGQDGLIGAITMQGSVVDYGDGVVNNTAIVLDSLTAQLNVDGEESLATQAGVISETGGSRPLEKTGAGALLLTAANTFTGAFTISEGWIVLNSSGSLAASLTDIKTGAGLNVLGSTSLAGGVANAGTLSLLNLSADTVLTVNGDYSGDGGVLVLETVVEGDGSATDRLVIAGHASGTTAVVIDNLGGLGAATSTGIRLIETGTSDAGAFSLAAPLTLGPYAYLLNLNAGDQDWYLVSSLTSAAAAYGNAPLVFGQAFTRLDGMDERLALRKGGMATGAWARVWGDDLEFTTATSGSGNLSTIKTRSHGVEAGVDSAPIATAGGDWVLGFSAGVGSVSADVEVPTGMAQISGTGLSFGASATWLGNGGTYVDLQGRVTAIEADFAASSGVLAEGEKLRAYAAGVEVGHRFDLGNGQSLTPHAQLSYGKLSGASFTDGDGVDVELGALGGMRGRLGLTWRAESASGARFFATGSIEHDFDAVAVVNVLGETVETEMAATWATLTLGGSFPMGDMVQGFGTVSYSSALGGEGDNSGLSAQAGLVLRW